MAQDRAGGTGDGLMWLDQMRLDQMGLNQMGLDQMGLTHRWTRPHRLSGWVPTRQCGSFVGQQGPAAEYGLNCPPLMG
jgi:hypothetical protein